MTLGHTASRGINACGITAGAYLTRPRQSRTVTFLSKKAFSVKLRPRNISVKNSVLALSSSTAHMAVYCDEERCYCVARILPAYPHCRH